LQHDRLAVSGQGRGKPITGPNDSLLRSKRKEAGMNSHFEIEEPKTAAEIIARCRDVPRRLYSPASPPKLASNDTRTDHAACKAITTIPRPPASPNNGHLKRGFSIKLQPAKPFERSRPEPACPSPTSSDAIGGRRSPRLVKRFGASAW
jgi:hypothetical protein